MWYDNLHESIVRISGAVLGLISADTSFRFGFRVPLCGNLQGY